jgi:hypothetical protein
MTDTMLEREARRQLSAGFGVFDPHAVFNSLHRAGVVGGSAIALAAPKFIDIATAIFMNEMRPFLAFEDASSQQCYGGSECNPQGRCHADVGFGVCIEHGLTGLSWEVDGKSFTDRRDAERHAARCATLARVRLEVIQNRRSWARDK